MSDPMKNHTSTWISIIVSIFLLISIWAYATVSKNVDRIQRLETQYEVILEKLKTIEKNLNKLTGD